MATGVFDDGAVVYVNGQEVWRINMPAAPAVVLFDTPAISAVSGTTISGDLCIFILQYG